MHALLRDVYAVLLFFAALFVVNVAVHFPYDTDGPREEAQLVETDADAFYEAVYQPDATGAESEYVEKARSEAHRVSVKDHLRQFIAERELERARALEVGAGSGALQDVVEDYTGLDIAASAARYFHKPFVHGSATELPFQDSSFELIWSIWTLEHVVNPERSLEELRRVAKNGGYLYLSPTWNNPTWAPHGYSVRPYGDLDLFGKIAKASLAVREQQLFRAGYHIPIRYLRLAATRFGGPSRLRYHSIDGNFETYWVPDADAVNSIDCFEARLWFETRGDEVLDPEPLTESARHACAGTLAVRVNKPSRTHY